MLTKVLNIAANCWVNLWLVMFILRTPKISLFHTSTSEKLFKRKTKIDWKTTSFLARRPEQNRCGSLPHGHEWRFLHVKIQNCLFFKLAVCLDTVIVFQLEISCLFGLRTRVSRTSRGINALTLRSRECTWGKIHIHRLVYNKNTDRPLLIEHV